MALQRPPNGTFDSTAAYVALSGVVSLDGRAILRPFKLEDIAGGQSAEKFQHGLWLDQMHDQSIAWLSQVRITLVRIVRASLTDM